MKALILSIIVIIVFYGCTKQNPVVNNYYTTIVSCDSNYMITDTSILILTRNMSIITLPFESDSGYFPKVEINQMSKTIKILNGFYTTNKSTRTLTDTIYIQKGSYFNISTIFEPYNIYNNKDTITLKDTIRINK